MIVIDGQSMNHMIALPDRPALPDVWARAANGDSGASGISVKQVVEHASVCVRRQAAAGNSASIAALGYVGSVDGTAQTALSENLARALSLTAVVDGRLETLKPMEAWATISPGVYGYAIEMGQAGRYDASMFAFSLLLCLPERQLDALVGLAVCTFRLGRYEEAHLFASESLKLDTKHPRACCVAGLCELQRGNRRSAQAYLAAGARIARSLPEHREDLRLAQRALLMMHLE